MKVKLKIFKEKPNKTYRKLKSKKNDQIIVQVILTIMIYE
jgi:hypothetical protein